jgi:hypothetical protein
MNTAVVALGTTVIVVGLIAALARKRVRIVVGGKVKLADIPAIFEKLHATPIDGNFAVFIFNPPGKQSRDEAINIQFSIENGTSGLDWVLLGASNITDKERFTKFASQRGYQVTEKEGNNVKYLRVEAGDLPALCAAVIREMYSLPEGTELDLIPEGFTWP